MPQATANGIQIEYETFGDQSDRPLLLVMGLGAQMIHWDTHFCQQLADTGHYVVRFDNRDAGLSQKIDDGDLFDMMALMADMMEGNEPEVPYTLDDMAADGIGLLDVLNIERAHIVGASLGGMVVQTMAINHPDRVSTLTSIMSTTGNPDLPSATEEAQVALMSQAEPNEAAVVKRTIDNAAVIGSPGFDFDVERATMRAIEAFSRCFCPEGTARQMAAIAVAGDRRARLQQLEVPALVIHGRDDCLIPVEGGIDTHAALNNADLMLIDGMGHDLPVGAWPGIIKGITTLTSTSS